MALSLGLSEAAFPPTRIDTTARVSIEKETSGFRITRIVLRTVAEVPGIDDSEFQRLSTACRSNTRHFATHHFDLGDMVGAYDASARFSHTGAEKVVLSR